MGKLDFSKVITPESVASDKAHAREAAIKAACSARIKAILDANTVSNIQGAFLADTLTADEKSIFATGHAWVTDMLAACRAMVDEPDADWESDAAWPVMPDGVVDLAARF